MRRYFSIFLTFVLLAASLYTPVLAEVLELIREDSSEKNSPITLSEELTLDLLDEQPEPEQTPGDTEPEMTPANVPSGYAEILKDHAVITRDKAGIDSLATLRTGGVVLIVKKGYRPRVALNTRRGIIKGYIDADCIREMDASQTQAYIDRIAAAGKVALYNDNLELPLGPVDCDFSDDSKEEESQDPQSLNPKGEGNVNPAEDILSILDDQSGESSGTPGDDLDLSSPSLDSLSENATASFKLNASTLSIGLKETYKGLRAIGNSNGSDTPVVTWRSSNKKIVKVNSKTGVIKGLSTGTATIYAKASDGSAASCKVTVGEMPKKVSVSPKSITLSVGMSGQLTPFVSGGISAGFTYNSSKKTVGKVDNDGRITALAPGNTTITVKTYNGKKATCKLTVTEAPASLKFKEYFVYLYCGETITVTAYTYDSKGNEIKTAITYSINASNSPDPDCVSVNASTGEVTALHEGKAILDATTPNGLIASCVLTVNDDSKDIELNMSSITIGATEVFKNLKAVSPSSIDKEIPSDQIHWKSSNSDVADVDSDGVIVGKKSGSSTITATLNNGKSAECSVTVMKEISSISISPSVGSLRIGKMGQYKIKLSPSGSGGSLIFESSDSSIATIDSDGIVTAISEGVAYIRVTSYNGKSATAKLVVQKDESGETVSEKIKYVLSIAQAQLNKPYIYGGGYSESNPKGFDCSGLVYWCYKHVGIKLKDSAYRQGYDETYPKIGMQDLKPGDVLFFDTNQSDGDKSDHAALYIGNGSFIHASSTAKKVIISSLGGNGSYYNRTFSWARRILS